MLEVALVPNSLYRRPLPADTIPFSSPEGRRIFADALASGGMDGYFRLAEQFHTQSEPAYCGLGTLVTAFLPAIYAALVGPTPSACVVEKKFSPDVTVNGETCRALADSIESSVVITVGSITLALAVIAAIAAFSSRETFRIHMNDLGNKNAVPVPKEEYDRIRKTGVDTPVA